VETIDIIVKWYLLTTLVSLAFTPFTLALFRPLADRGAAFARILSVLLFVWPAWLLSGIASSVVPFGNAALWTTLVLGGAGSWWWGWRSGVLNRESLFHVAVAEAGFLAMFAGYVWFRGYDPTIQWQEKLSDLMMLASTMQAESMPPNDAWLAGEPINYYYAGYVPWAGIAKLVGTTPAIAYNLALATVFASTVLTAIGVAANVIGHFYSLTMARVAGGLAALFMIFMATPWSVKTVYERRDTVWNASWFENWWAATRQFDGGTQDAITEFPAFSFQLGDLHPHLLALPFTLLALAMAWMLAILPSKDGQDSLRNQWGRIVLAGGVAGGLYAMNSWDLPVYLLIAIAGLLVGTGTWSQRERVGGVVLLVASALVLWLPFHWHFESPTPSADNPVANAVENIPLVGGILASLTSWYGDATTIGQYTGLLGFAWVVALALIGWSLWERRNRNSDPLVTKVTLAVGGVILLLGLLVPMPLLLLAGLPIVVILHLWQRDSSLNPTNVALTLFAAGFMLTIIPEIVYLLDVFNSRMNMVFKLYYQAWTLLALGAAISIVVLWDALRRVPVARIVLAASVAAMAVGGVSATTVGMHQWVNWRGVPDEWIGMDGLHFLETQPGWEGEHDAIAWLLENAGPDDVMLSAGGCEFTLDVGTTAAGSGVPSILGWEGHESQWHLGQARFREEITQRIEDINTLWETLDPALLDRYGITLIYMGPVEQRGDPYNREDFTSTCAPGPFANATNPEFPGEGWTEVYSDDTGVRIYRRNEA
jgi:YYY domain-containing protein